MKYNNEMTRWLTVLSFLAPTTALAGGFALTEQSASNMGTSNAGAAANPEGPSALFFNPAGMSRLDGTQITLGASVLEVSEDFKGGATDSLGNPVAGGDGGDYIPTTVIPNLYMTHKVNETVSFGLGLNVPYGIDGDYDDDFTGRYFADETDLKVVSLSPSIALSDGNGFSLGFGVNVLYADGTLSKFQDYKGDLGPNAPQGHFEAQGDDVDVTFTAGMLYNFNDGRTDIGLSYRTGTELKLDGDAELTNAPNPLGNPSIVDLSEDVEVPLQLPPTLRLGLRHQLTDSVALLAGGTWTQWSKFEDLDIISTESNAGELGTISFLGSRSYGGDDTVGHVTEKWKDTWRYSVGAIWQATSAWKLRAGYSHDESPVNDDYRTARVPSDDRDQFTLGFQYAHVPSGWTVDVAAGIILIDDVDVDEVEYGIDDKPLNNKSNFSGTYELQAYTAGVSVTKTF